MSREEFESAVERGRLHEATETTQPGEGDARTPLSRGEVNGYSYDDIAHFYAARRGYGDRAFKESKSGRDFDSVGYGRMELIGDALLEGKEVPYEIEKEYREWVRAQRVARKIWNARQRPAH